jgi:hypothetical protein
MRVWTELNFLLCPVVNSSERNREPSGFIKGKEFTDQLSVCQLLRKASLYG